VALSLGGGCNKKKDQGDAKKGEEKEKQARGGGEDKARQGGAKSPGKSKGGARDSRPAQPAASDPHAPPKDLPPLEKVLKEVEAAKALKKKYKKSSEAFDKEALPKLKRWSDLIFGYTHAGKKEAADKLSAALVALRNHWGKKLFPPEKFDAFGRDRFRVGPAWVCAAQYFEPVRYYKNDPRILKYYRFSVYLRKNVVARYFLERSNLKGPHFVLGMQSGAKHKQVKTYGAKKPTYWELKKEVMADVKKKLQKVPRNAVVK